MNMKHKDIWVVAEHHQDMVQPVTYQLITKANQIKGDKRVVVILFQTKEQSLEKDIIKYGPDEIIIVEHDKMKDAPDSLIADLLAQLDKRYAPNSVLFGATVIGRSISARLQAKLQTGLTADCLDLSFEEDLLIQTKPSYGDNIMCEIICPNHFPQMATVRPNIFVAQLSDKREVKLTKEKDLEIVSHNRIQVYEEKPILSKSDSIANANRVIALGRGMSSKRSIEISQELASKLGAKIGVTRPLTDLKPFSVDDQIGQSGSSIAPKLLITLGVHGAVQFTTGIGKAEYVVAVNNNPKAPIFNEADYHFIGDGADFVEALLKIIQ